MVPSFLTPFGRKGGASYSLPQAPETAMFCAVGGERLWQNRVANVTSAPGRTDTPVVAAAAGWKKRSDRAASGPLSGWQSPANQHRGNP